MREITRLMIREYNIKKLGYDFMGYSFTNINSLSFHHLIVPHRECKNLHIEKDGYTKWNGAILYTTPHEYLHLIEAKDYELFLKITSEMTDINIKGYIDRQNLIYIDDCLNYFEKEHSGKTTKKGKPLIKEAYLKRR